jgi:hypothetical protein
MASAKQDRIASLVHRSLALLAAAFPLAAALSLSAQPQAAGPEPTVPAAAAAPSEAERLVFQHEHLANIGGRRSLRYLYAQEAQGKPGVNDSAVLTLSTGVDGRCCDVHGDYLSGPLAVQLPDVRSARSNPVLLYFLEAEVRGLQRTTAGQAAHFRRRIRQALADSASVDSTTVAWGGKAVPAKIVQLAPFLDDPYKGRFVEHAGTRYAFVFSDAVPGGVYQMRALVPGPAPGAAPLARRSLTLAEPQ